MQWPKIILTYHKIHDAKNFDLHLKLLAGRNDVLITFDDGDRSVYENAFPLLKKYGRNAILFVITDLIDTDKPFWWDEVEYYLGKEKSPAVIRSLKTMKNDERLSYLNNMRNFNREKNKPRYKQLTTAELKEMSEAGVAIANHSHTHPMLDKCTEKELLSEIDASVSWFDNAGFGEPFLFAYPNGNTDQRTEKILRQKGITTAFLFNHKMNVNTDPMRISRLSVDDHTSIWKMRLILSGVHSRLLPVRKALKKFLP